MNDYLDSAVAALGEKPGKNNFYCSYPLGIPRHEDRGALTGIKTNGPLSRAGRGDDHLRPWTRQLVTAEATAQLGSG